MAKKKAAKKAAGKRTGRPPKFPGQKVEESVSVWFTSEQLAKIEAAEEAGGLKRSDIIREGALEKAEQIVEQSKRKPSGE